MQSDRLQLAARALGSGSGPGDSALNVARGSTCLQVVAKLQGISVKEARHLVKQGILAKLPSGPSAMHTAFRRLAGAQGDSTGSITKPQFKHLLLMKANLAFGDTLFQQVWESYDDDRSGVIDYRK